MRAKRKNQGWYDGDGRYPAEPGSMPPYPEGNGPGYPSQDGPYEEGPYLGGAYEEDAGYDPDYGEYTEKYPEGYGDGSWVPDDEAYEDDEDYDEPAEKPETRSIFRPETRKPNFVISVLLNTIRVLLVVVLLAGVAGLGTVVGIAKGYVDTAPDLNLVKLGSQAQTSFIYDRNKKLITEYKGTYGGTSCSERRSAVPGRRNTKRIPPTKDISRFLQTQRNRRITAPRTAGPGLTRLNMRG